MSALKLELFHKRYRLLYSTVPTDGTELNDLYNTISGGITQNDYVANTTSIIRQYVRKRR